MRDVFGVEIVGRNHLISSPHIPSQIAKAYLNVEQDSGTDSGFFCSELVAEAYKRMGLLPETVT